MVGVLLDCRDGWMWKLKCLHAEKLEAPPWPVEVDRGGISWRQWDCTARTRKEGNPSDDPRILISTSAARFEIRSEFKGRRALTGPEEKYADVVYGRRVVDGKRGVGVVDLLQIGLPSSWTAILNLQDVGK